MRIGIFDHMSSGLGGGQLVAAQMAVQLSRGHEVELIHYGDGYLLSSLANALMWTLAERKNVLYLTLTEALISLVRSRRLPIFEMGLGLIGS